MIPLIIIIISQSVSEFNLKNEIIASFHDQKIFSFYLKAIL